MWKTVRIMKSHYSGRGGEGGVTRHRVSVDWREREARRRGFLKISLGGSGQKKVSPCHWATICAVSELGQRGGPRSVARGKWSVMESSSRGEDRLLGQFKWEESESGRD